MKCLFFLHIPKTAGRTLNNYLAQIYDEDSRFISRGVVDLVRFTARKKEEVKDIQLVSGHFPFGYHKPLFTDYNYITLLREPVNRIMSFYYYTKRSPQERDYQFINDNDVGIEEYIFSCRTKENDNGMVRKMSGEGTRTAYGKCTEDMLKRAIENIENHFSVVGLQERFCDTIKLLQRFFDWPSLPYESQNIAKSRPGKLSLPRKTINIIEEHNVLDMELYEYARKRFMEKMEETVPK
ncbi:MAG: sulfotransferase family 2 domain-containing protein [Planctomycetota bacterium]|jgi:hypothetical protein